MGCTKCTGEEYCAGYCTSCFSQAMERRISNALRDSPIQKGQRLLVSHPLCLVVLQDILRGLPITLIEVGPADREVLAWTADDEIDAFCDALFHGTALPKLGNTPKLLKLFLPMTDAEVAKFAGLKGIVWQPRPKSRSHAEIEQLTKKYPELKSALLKSLAELQ